MIKLGNYYALKMFIVEYFLSEENVDDLESEGVSNLGSKGSRLSKVKFKMKKKKICNGLIELFSQKQLQSFRLLG